ncbi:MAG TPA: PAS domain S-box protein [Phycisphaerales bacterium]|nr:PAS domain S-box protein [Phycisphaerales bacterium]
MVSPSATPEARTLPRARDPAPAWGGGSVWCVAAAAMGAVALLIGLVEVGAWAAVWTGAGRPLGVAILTFQPDGCRPTMALTGLCLALAGCGLILLAREGRICDRGEGGHGRGRGAAGAVLLGLPVAALGGLGILQRLGGIVLPLEAALGDAGFVADGRMTMAAGAACLVAGCALFAAGRVRDPLKRGVPLAMGGGLCLATGLSWTMYFVAWTLLGGQADGTGPPLHGAIGLGALGLGFCAAVGGGAGRRDALVTAGRGVLAYLGTLAIWIAAVATGSRDPSAGVVDVAHWLALVASGMAVAAMAGARVGQLARAREVAVASLQGTLAQEATQRASAEREARRGQEKLRAIFEQAAVGLRIVDAEGRFLAANPAMERITGYSEQELMEMRVWDLTHPDDAAEDIEATSRIFAGEIGGFALEKRYLRKDGSVVWVELTASGLAGDDGRASAVIGVVQDITERKLAEAGLRSSERRKRAILDSALDCVITMDQQGRVVEFNPAAERTFGYRREEAVGRTVAELVIPPELRPSHWEGLRRHIATGEGPVLGTRVEVMALRADGSRLPVELAIAPAVLDGGELFYTAYLRDITERVRAEQSLRESEARFRIMADSAPVMIWMTGPRGEDLYVNQRWREFTGRAPGEVDPGAGPAAWDELVHPDDRAAAAARFQAAGGAPRPFTVRYRLRRHDGEHRWVMDSGAPRATPDGTFAGYVGSCVDIHDLEEARRLLAARARQQAAVMDLGQLALRSTDLGPLQDEATAAVAQALGLPAVALLELEPDGLSLVLAAAQGWAGEAVGSLRVPIDPGNQAGFTLRAVSAVVVPDFAGETRFAPPVLPGGGRAGSAISVALPGHEGPLGVLLACGPEPRVLEEHDVDFVRSVGNVLAAALSRQRTEEALREAELHFRETLENLELVAVMLDTEGRVTFCNEFLLRLTGYERDEVVGRDWIELFLPEAGRARARQALRRARDEEWMPAHNEAELLTRDGQTRVMSWNNTVLRDSFDRVIGVTSLGIDVTRQRWAERQLMAHKERLEELVAERTAALEASHQQLRLRERLASMGTLAAGLGHDISNLLLPVRCRLDSLADAALPDEARDHLEGIRHSIEYLQQLTGGLRMLSMDPGEARGHGVTDVRAWWKGVAPLLRTALRTEIRLVGDFPRTVPEVAITPHALTQAVLNLVTNSGDALTGPGLVRVWARQAEEGGPVELGVTDDGPGMPEEVRRRAVEPFFTTKTRRLSTGLGLALVHGIVKHAGGSLDIRSVPGEGTEVVLRLPAVRPSGRLDTADGASGGQVAEVSLSDPRLAAFAVAMLGPLGFELGSVHNGRDGARGLLVTDGQRTPLERAHRFIKGGEDRRVIYVGAPDRRWKDLGAIIVDPADGPGALRMALAQAALARQETER